MSSDEKLTPERAVRLLRAKGAELEATVLAGWQSEPAIDITLLAADIALIAQLLADHIERMEYLVAHPLITTSAEASGTKYVTKSGKVLTDDDIQALADEAEAGYDVSELKVRTCLATRWNGHPVFDGEHEHHFFKYGPNDMYEGHCAGWPKEWPLPCGPECSEGHTYKPPCALRQPWGPDHPDYDEMGQ